MIENQSLRKYDIIIIGGGLGGLFTGALLARNGKKVAVIEKNDIIGGGLQCFPRRGKFFETGMHVIGGFNPGSNLDLICRYLGIRHKLAIKNVDNDCIDEITYREPAMKFSFRSGREGFRKSLVEQFPDEEAGISAYIECIYNLANEVDMFYLRQSGEAFPVHSSNFFIPADKLIASFVSDSILRELLAYLNPLYGGVPDSSPAYVHALINVLYIEGSARFIGGSQQLADSLADVICQAGGAIFKGEEVVAVNIDEGSAQGITTKTGKTFFAEYVVSSIHPETLFPLLPPKSFTKAYISRLQSLPKSASAFTLFIDLKPDSLPYINHTCYFVDRPGMMWSQQSLPIDESWPYGFMYMTPPETHNDLYASRLLVHCVVDYKHFARWSDSSVGNRPAEYKMFKDRLTAQVLKRLEEVLPGIGDKIAHVYAATPLTIRDYYHTPEGAIFGYRKDCNSLMASQIPVWTKVKNLLLTGQNLNLHGICGVPLTAISTAEAILGRSILPAINASE